MKYIALTIGPIYKTISRQRRIRSVFAASYFFSYTMKKMLENLLDKGIEEDQILVPSAAYLNDSDFINTGCGIYPDRMILESQNDSDFQKLLDTRTAVFKHLADKIKADKSSLDQAEILNYLEAYLQIYLLEIDIPKNQDTINEINKYLDSLELQTQFPSGIDSDFLLSFFERVSGHFIYEDAFGKNAKRNRFDTLEEIASRELSRIPGQEDDYKTIVQNNIEQNIDSTTNRYINPTEEAFYTDLKNKFEYSFEQYHKYIAVVYADGDSFGKYIGNLNADEEQLRLFSKKLTSFAKNAKDRIVDYGGAPVYIGGDDLLFFAPVVSRKTGENSEASRLHIFDLIDEIDEVFFKVFPQSSGSPTLSFGISISYYKYPINEALEEAYDLLMAAKDKKSHPVKNAVELKILKNSGQYFQLGMDKGELNELKSPNLYTEFKSMLQNHINGDQFINSLTYGIGSFEYLFADLLLRNDNKDAVRNLFANSFDESIHRQNDAFIQQLIQYIFSVYQQQKNILIKDLTNEAEIEKANKKALSTIYSTLRFINFLTTKNHKHELTA